jgi:hypothetical protein
MGSKHMHFEKQHHKHIVEILLLSIEFYSLRDFKMSNVKLYQVVCAF